mgnify:CR=1 FL=1
MFDIDFKKLDYKLLMEFESFLLLNKCKPNTISLRMRTLRALFNRAIRMNLVPPAYYPFNTKHKVGYKVINVKSDYSIRSLSEEDLKSLKEFDIERYPNYAYTYYYFMFSYYARGINFIDMAKLRRNNAYDGRITYIRQKTGKSMSLRISEPIEYILNRIGNGKDGYLFPILSALHQSEQQQKDRIKKIRKKTNAELKRIGTILELDISLTTYVARHTYASQLMRNDVPVHIIKNCLGHSSESMTYTYLERLGFSKTDETDQYL